MAARILLESNEITPDSPVGVEPPRCAVPAASSFARRPPNLRRFLEGMLPPMPIRDPQNRRIKKLPFVPPDVALEELREESVQPEGGGGLRVVGIGASAGGLDAFLDLLQGIPSDTGLTFVLIQHLDPHHESMLASIIARATVIPVEVVTDGLSPRRDCIYVIPPGTQLTLQGGILRVCARTAKVPHRPLDTFFSSLADDQKSRAIGIVLSGNDADGALGLEAIREAGGITFAQTAESAKFEVMPRAAAPAADFVLSPAAIAEQLVSISRRAAMVERSGQDAASLAGVERILRLVGTRHSVDFSHFKPASVHRRIERRLLLGNHESLTAYADVLEHAPGEIETLYQDLLIGVTAFFREPERFAALTNVVFPSIVEGRGPEQSVRIWVAGCSTGEEVYSLAMILREFLDTRPGAPRISIYGTDINENSLRKARSGLYSERALHGVSPERLARFFTPAAGGFKIAKALRELCVFAAHDVTRDPPYSKIDLVTCCNVLIYFDAELQRKAVALLQYALAPGGFLMLGSSENLRGMSSKIVAVSTHPLIYRKREVSGQEAALEVSSRSPERLASWPLPAPSQSGRRAQDEDSFLAAHLAPCGVLINAQMEITRIRGEVGAYLAMEPGEASLNLFRLIVHQELVAGLRLAVRSAFRDREPVVTDGTVVETSAGPRLLVFEVIPYDSATPSQDLCWVLFHSSVAPAKRKGSAARKRSETDALRHALAAAIEDRRQLADDAAAAAEEAQSSDEELRSSNEELETAKEELQSANEELSTLNEELRLRNVTLGRINDDIENLLGAVEIPILFVGVDLTVRRFNVTAGKLLNLRPDSTGRPLREVQSSLDVALLEKLVGAVMATAAPADVEVQDNHGDWRLLRIRVHRTYDGTVDGAIVAVIDINLLKRSVLAAEEATAAANILSQASALLASSLDYETTLESLARLSTAKFADWCAVDLINDDGSIRHLTVSHSNPVMRDLALEFQKAAFSLPDVAPGAPQALRRRESVLLSDLAEWQATGTRPEAKIMQLIGALGVRSLISVPLIVRDRVVGSTTFSTSGRRYELVDLQLAEELAQRAAIAIDTAMLFREAESANRYKDQFLGTVAHELRTPLTSIIGWVQLAKDNPEVYEDAFARISEAGHVLRLFTEDLLDITRIRERKLSIEMAEIDLIAVVKSAIDITAPAAKLRQIEVAAKLGDNPVPVHGDSVRLLQVVWNLLSNAIKFTPPEGEIVVRIDREGDQVRLSVRDNGSGISADFLPHVFELYRQADESAQQAPGLGIGLSIVAEIVKLHGGTVEVESPGLGRGATFCVTLPLLQEPGHHATVAKGDSNR